MGLEPSLGELVDDLESLADDLQFAEWTAPVRFEIWIGDADEPVIADEYLAVGSSNGVVTVSLGAKGRTEIDQHDDKV